MSKRYIRWVAVWTALLCGVGYAAPVVLADTLQSSHYQFTETDLGGGGLIQSNSANFQSSESIGDAIGSNSASSNYQVEAGGKTTNDPALTFTINNGNVSFGSFSAATPAVTTTTFSVTNYTSYGYIVQIAGNAPSNGSHTITAMGTSGYSVPGTEQFGINLVANTSPVSFGANPNLGAFGFGSATPNYGTANVFRYVSGETIASAPKSSGQTTYTISYLVNVSSLTPGGQYTTNQVLICTGTY